MKTKAQKLNITKFPYEEYDDKGNLIYYELSNKAWSKYKFNKDNLVIYQEYSSGSIKKFNERGKIIYYKKPNGEWYKNEFDDKNNLIYYKDHDGNFWDKELMPDIPFIYDFDVY